MKYFVLLIFTLLHLLVSVSSDAAILRVKHNAAGINNGSSWANAFTTLNAALAAASAGDEIWVAAGTYKPTTGTNVDLAFVMKSDVSLYGGFLGFEVNRDNRNWNSNPTILSGDIGSASNTDNSKWLVSCFDVTNCTIDGFYLEGAYWQLGSGTWGQALRVVNGSNITASHCVIRNNTGYSTGALVSGNSFLVLDNCLFLNNWIDQASVVGTGSSDSGFLIRSCTFTQNHMIQWYAKCVSGDVGSDITVENSIIWGNDNLQPNFSGGTVSHSIVEGYEYYASDEVVGFVYTLDPEFISPGNLDFKLQPQSCAVDPGWYLTSEQTYDLAHNIREQNGYLDLGCYEASSCSQPNDACAEAINLEIGADPQIGSTKCAVASAVIDSGCQNSGTYSSWYSFVAPASGSVRITADFTIAFPTIFGTSFNLRIGLYTGTCNSLLPVGCMNNAGPNESEVYEINPLIPGELYYVRIDGLNFQEGAFTVRVEDMDPPCTGDFDANGLVNISDLLVFNSGYGCTSNCGVQDLDENDIVNIADLLVFASVFGTFCSE